MTTKPLLSWEQHSSAASHPELVWGSTLDKRYLIEVQRIDESRGRLVMFDHEKDDKLIHESVVFLSYGALFGPDVADIAEWQDKAVAVVDSQPI